MTKLPCLYAIVRFSPFIETGEFANVGIVMIGPEQRFFDFKLLIYRYSRVTRFFEHLNPKVFRETMRTLRDELKRAAALLRQHGFDKRSSGQDADFAKRLFAEIVRPRETVLRFSEPRAVLTEDPKTTLAELYAFYVERNFVTREYQEAVLERGMRQWLRQADLSARFERMEVGNAEYHAAFPFVERRGDFPVKAIKPLHLAHSDPSRILDHGGQWLFRVQALKRRQLLPERVLFAVSAPAEGGLRQHAVAEIVDSLENAGTLVVPYADKQRILDFAAAPVSA